MSAPELGHGAESDVALSDMPVERRDQLVSEVWAFLVERGYSITYVGPHGEQGARR